MAHVSIISSQSGEQIFEGAPRYIGAYLKPGYLEFPAIGSPTAISWHVGDYVVYPRTGKTYRLYRTPQIAEQGDTMRYGAAFLYENVQFFDDSKRLELCPFTDLVPGDNTIHFSTQNVVSFFGKPLNVAERVQACLENQYGAGTWEVRIVTTTDPDLLELLDTEVEFSVSGASCQQALDKVYELWNGLGWIHTVENGVNVITIGASNIRTSSNTTVPFAYDNGLVRVERSIANADRIGTRLYAYGSMKNMDATYYRGLNIKDAESVDIEHLMIPLASWGLTDGLPDARKAYIENATAISALGLIPRTAYFDGTGDLPDIHPTIERMTIGEVYDAGGAGYLPNLNKWSRSQRIDEVVSASNPSDHGTSAEQGQKYAENFSSTLGAVSESFIDHDWLHATIYSATLAHGGKLTLRFGSNRQVFTLDSAWGPTFDLRLTITAGTKTQEIPLTVVRVSDTSYYTVLPETVTLTGTTAGALEVKVDGYIGQENDSTARGGEGTFTSDPATTISGGVEYELDKTFSLTIPQIGFDIDNYADLGNGKTISMKTGMCAGRDFEIKDATYNSSSDSWQLTLYRSVDEDLNIMFPNADYQIAAGDQYVLLDIAMPEMYVTVASQRLLAAAQRLLADISVEQPFYAPQIDAKVVYNEGRVLREGMWMDVTFDSAQEYVLIDSITIDENGSNIPTYEIALREKKGLDWTENVGSSSSSRSSSSVNGSDQQQAAGTVTSVGMTVPEGMEVLGSPINSAGILSLQLKQGYIIPRVEDLGAYFQQNATLSTLVELKSAYSYLGVKDGIFFSGATEADFEVQTINGQRVIHSRLPFYSDSFISAGGISDGGGSAGGNATLVAQTYGGTLSATGIDPINFYSKEKVDQLIATAGTVQTVAGVSPVSGDIPVASLKSALGLGAAAAYGVGSVASGNTGLVTGGDVWAAIDELPEPMVFKGCLGTGGTITSLPAASSANEGFTYKVITAGTYRGTAAKVGDTFISNGSSWILIPSGDEPEGTVTSVGLSMPTGFSVSSSPITSSGTLTVAFASGYSLPTTAKQSNWDTAYGWGNHANAGYLLASTAASTYATITALNGVSGRVTTLEGRTNWDTYFGVDENGDIYVKKNGNTARNFYSWGAVSAGGLSSGGGSEGASLAAVWASLKTNSDDYANEKINAYHIPIGSGLSVVNGLIVANNAGTVTSVKVGTTTYNPTDGVVSLPAYPTSLPASDVPAWAKADTKPSYAFSEITGTASTSQIPTLAISKISGLQDALDDKQPLDADLTAIAGLTGTSGFLKKTAANTWALDTNTYLTTSSAASTYVSGVALNGNYLRVTKNGANTDLTIPYATQAQIPNWAIRTAFNPNAVEHAIESNYGESGSTRTNVPNEFLYGSVLTLSARGFDSNLSAQFIWDVRHGTSYPGWLWFRTKDSSSGWRDWTPVYTGLSLTKSVLTDLLESSNGYYVKKSGDTMTGVLNVTGQITPMSLEFRNMSSSAGNGGYIDFHFNNSSADFTTRIIESASGILSISGGLSLGTTLQLGDGVLSWDGSANAWKLTGNFYATGFISAGGVSSGGGTAGVDLTAVWNNLVANTGEGLNKKIHTAHLPTVTITGTNISGTGTYSGTGGSASTLTLNLTALDTTYSAGTGISISASNVISLNSYEYYSATTSRTANTVLAAPNGSAGAASFRALVAADIPTLTKSKISDFPTNVSAFTNDAGYITSYIDTKNTAGSTNTSSKIFLIGATSQATNPQTYSHDTAYVGTDGHLYSDSKQVVNLSGNQALTNKTYNGYTLAAACAKGVTDNSSNADVTSTDTNLITGRTLYYQLAKKGYTTNTGTVTSVAAGTGLSGGTITTSGTISLAASGVTAGTYYKTTVDTYGRVTSGSYANLSAAINGDLTEGSSNPVDADFYIAQYAGGGTTTTTYHRRPHSALYGYIKDKLDSVYVPLTRTVNSKALSANITLTLDDIGNGSTRSLANYLPLAGGTMTGAITPASGQASVRWVASMFQAGSLSQYGASSIELNTTSSTGHGGYIDFHYNGSTADYTSRIIENASGRLLLSAGMVYTTGNLGAGTASPTYPLQVVGHAAADGFTTTGAYTANLSSAGWYTVYTANGTNATGQAVILQLRRNFYNASNEAYTISVNVAFNGKVSITQLSGGANTQLISKIRVDYVNSGALTIAVYYSGTSANGLYVSGIGAGVFCAPTAVSSANGTVVEFALQPNGVASNSNILATGAITAGSASDARLKTNIQSLSAEAAKRIVMALNPVTFTWNEKATELYDQYKGDDLGMIAQEVEPYLPQAIGTIFENYKRLDYDKVVTPLVKVAQDHESRIRQLEAENRELRKEVERLRMN